jgi:hypothetical protein
MKKLLFVVALFCVASLSYAGEPIKPIHIDLSNVKTILHKTTLLKSNKRDDTFTLTCWNDGTDDSGLWYSLYNETTGDFYYGNWCTDHTFYMTITPGVYDIYFESLSDPSKEIRITTRTLTPSLTSDHTNYGTVYSDSVALSSDDPYNVASILDVIAN